MKIKVRKKDGTYAIFMQYGIIDVNKFQPKTERLVIGLYEDGRFTLCRCKNGVFVDEYGTSVGFCPPDYWMDIPTYINDTVITTTEDTIDSQTT